MDDLVSVPIISISAEVYRQMLQCGCLLLRVQGAIVGVGQAIDPPVTFKRGATDQEIIRRYEEAYGRE